MNLFIIESEDAEPERVLRRARCLEVCRLSVSSGHTVQGPSHAELHGALSSVPLDCHGPHCCMGITGYQWYFNLALRPNPSHLLFLENKPETLGVPSPRDGLAMQKIFLVFPGL